MYKIKRYFSGVLKQAKMVRWPKKVDMLTSFAVVVVVITIAALSVTVDNFIITKLLTALEEQFGASGEAAASIRALMNLF